MHRVYFVWCDSVQLLAQILIRGCCMLEHYLYLSLFVSVVTIAKSRQCHHDCALAHVSWLHSAAHVVGATSALAIKMMLPLASAFYCYCQYYYYRLVG